MQLPIARRLLVLPLIALVFAAARPDDKPPQGDMPAMPQPTEQHKQLLEGVGEWEGTLTSFMPGMPETPTLAKETVEAVGSFWTNARFTCDFMGMPYVGMGCTGYDVEKKKYVGTWFDSMSSYLAHMEGEMNPKTGALVMRWIAPDMATGNPAPHHYEAVFSGDSYTSTFFTGEGAGTKTMVIAMKRKGAKPEGKK